MNHKNLVSTTSNNKAGRMRKRLQYIICIVMLGFSFQHSFSQTISVKASVDRDHILIGEPIRLKLEAMVPMGTDAKWFVVDTISHFEFIEQSKVDTAGKTDNKTYKQLLTITSFDSGRQVIPPLALEANGKSYLTDSLPVLVAFSQFDPSKDYHDIKDILEVANPETRYVNWALAAFTLLSLLAVIYFLRKRTVVIRSPAQKTDTRLSPLEEAIQSLQDLKKQRLPEQGQVKLYYTLLNDILRWFLLRKMKMTTLEKTNEELILQVKSSGLPKDAFISLAQMLRMTDAVKFAKFIPGIQENELSFKTIETSVESLNNLSK